MKFKWIDLGLVFDVTRIENRPSWYFSHAQAPNAVVMEDYVRVYFTAREKPAADGNTVSRAMYVDLDPSRGFKTIYMPDVPILDLGQLGEFDEHGTYPFTVLRGDLDYVAIYGGWSRSHSVPFDISLGLARSVDGKHFTRVSNGPILAPTLNEPFVITSPKLRKFGSDYFLTYTAGTRWFTSNGKQEIVYKLRSATSRDLISWCRNGINLIPDKLNDLEAQACGDVFRGESGYHMFYCYREGIDFRSNKKNSYKIGYAFSKDLKFWERIDDVAGVEQGIDSWDSQMCAYPNVFSFKGLTYMLYLGNGTGVNGFGAKQLVGKLP